MHKCCQVAHNSRVYNADFSFFKGFSCLPTHLSCQTVCISVEMYNNTMIIIIIMIIFTISNQNLQQWCRPHRDHFIFSSGTTELTIQLQWLWWEEKVERTLDKITDAKHQCISMSLKLVFHNFLPTWPCTAWEKWCQPEVEETVGASAFSKCIGRMVHCKNQ